MYESGVTTKAASSPLALFLRTLANEGRAVVSSQPLPDESVEDLTTLRAIDIRSRAESLLEPPPFAAPAALWAARLFYQLARFTVCRNLDDGEITAACAVACPETRSPAVDWSVDLTLRHLPGLFQVARHLSNADPLVQRMKNLAVEWPLSSPGIPGLSGFQIDHFINQPALARLYADRVIAHGDTSRLGDPRVDDGLRGDLGIHHALAPVLAAKLFASAHDTH